MNGVPIRVLFVNTRSALGADVAVHVTLMRHLGAAGCEVFLATNSRSADHAKLLQQLTGVEGLRILALDLGSELTGAKGKLGKVAAGLRAAATSAKALARLSGFVRRNRIDIIHSTDRPRDALLSTLLARATGRKNLLHIHIKWDAGIGGLTKWAADRSDAMLAISDFVRTSMVDGGIPAAKIHTALNATDPREFDPDRVQGGVLRKSLGLPADTPLVGVVGRIMVWKGQLDAVEAFAKVRQEVPDAVLALVGREDTQMGGAVGDYGAQIRQRIAELGLGDSVRFAGWFDDMPGVFADLDVACVPSWEEPFGLVVTEAMAMRKPVVGYHSGALPEIIDEGTEGHLVEPKDYGALAGAIASLLRDPTRRETIGRNGRERVIRQFTPGRQAAEVAAIYRKVCGKA